MSAPYPTDIEVLGLVEAVRHVPAAVGIVDASGRIIYVNPRTRDLADRQLGESIPDQMTEGLEIFHLDGRPYEQRDWPVSRSMASGERVVDEEYFYALPGGGRVVVRCSSAPVRNAAGRIVAGVFVLTDLTSDRRAQAQLAYYDRLLENTDDAIVGTDAQFRLTVWNPAAERLYGYLAVEALGRDARDVASYEGDPARLELERSLLETDRARSELTAYRKDGSRVDVEMVAVAVRDDRDEVVGYLGVHRDVSERKRVERVQQRLVSIVENSADFIAIAKLDGTPTFLNEAGRRMVGLPLDGDITQASILDFFAPADQGAMRDELLPRIAERARWPAETELRLRHLGTGALIPVLWDAFQILDPRTGEPIAIATVTRDISERKRAEALIDQRAGRQAAVAQLGVKALESDSLQPLLHEAVGLVTRTLNVDLALLVEARPGEDELAIRASAGWRSGAIGDEGLPAGANSQAGYTLAAGAPVVAGDLRSETRFSVPLVVQQHGAQSAVTVVVPGREGALGVLGAFATERRSFSDNDVSFMQAVANIISGAFETARSEAVRRDDREAERRRIARDLHDEALQGLTHALALARRRSPDLDGMPHDELADVLRRVGQQLRAAIFDLRLAEEENRPFAERLNSLVATQAAMAGPAQVRLDISDRTPPVPADRATDVLRIVGESLTNARRHADASEIRVAVTGSPRMLRLEVSDDGRGFDPDAAPSGLRSTGLRGIRERAALLNADLQLTARPGGGTVVGLELALGDAVEADVDELRVLLVEDHVAVREAIAAMLEREPDLTVVGQAGSLAEARGMLGGVDVAVLDLALPDGNGGDLIDELRATSPGASALVLSASVDRAEIARAVQRGAAATIDKMAHLDEVVDAVRGLRTHRPPPDVT
jgi:PAS domain S-box-containing protein